MPDSLVEELRCPICLALFQDPHMLPSCGHNFCLACLRSAVPGGQGACPECRGPFQTAELMRNRALGSLAGMVRRGQAAGLPGAPAGPWPFCEEHDEPLKLFCGEHRALLCVICRDLPEHRYHSFLPIKEAAKLAQEKLKPYLKSLKKLLKEKTKNETDQRKKIEVLKNFSEDLLDHISRGFEALHQILHSKEEGMKLMVQEAKRENMERMEDSLASLKKEVSSRTETIAKVEAAFEAADLVVFLKDFEELMEQVVEDNQGERYDSSDEDENRNEDDNSDEDENRDEDENCDEDDNRDEDDNSDEDENRDKDDSSDEDDAEVISVSWDLKRIKESLDFEVWKEKLERKIPGKECLS